MNTQLLAGAAFIIAGVCYIAGGVYYLRDKAQKPTPKVEAIASETVLRSIKRTNELLIETNRDVLMPDIIRLFKKVDKLESEARAIAIAHGREFEPSP